MWSSKCFWMVSETCLRFGESGGVVRMCRESPKLMGCWEVRGTPSGASEIRLIPGRPLESCLRSQVWGPGFGVSNH